MGKVTFAFTSGKMLTLETLCDDAEEFFVTNSDKDGELPGWLVFSDGYAVQTGNVDWMRVEETS